MLNVIECHSWMTLNIEQKFFCASLTYPGEQSVSAYAARTDARAKLLATEPYEYGGAERDRTADPLLAKQVLSQLSYSPTLRNDS